MMLIDNTYEYGNIRAVRDSDIVILINVVRRAKCSPFSYDMLYVVGAQRRPNRSGSILNCHFYRTLHIIL